MGGGRFNVNAYRQQAAAAAERPFDAGFTAEKMCEEFDPKKVSVRYSKKGPFNGFRSVITVLIGLDVTGSMGDIPRDLLKGKLGSLMVDLKKTFNRPNENLQISFAGVGDSRNDVSPLQVTHFESDNRFAQQLQKIWLEGKGGGNGAESYNLLWWYAANKTQLNYVREEGRKGILITVGDDNVHPELTPGEIQKHLDPDYHGGDISNAKLLEAVREQYDVYHIIVTDGQAYIHDNVTEKPKTKAQQEAEVAQWKTLLGKENIVLTVEAGVADAIANIVKRHRPVVKAGMANLSDDEWDKKNKENLTDEQWVEVLSYAVCPLTGKYMSQPGDWSGSKRAYEKEYVIKYISEHGADPITKQPLKLANLNFKINSNISQLCSDYKAFFDALPEPRRIRLVQLALEQMRTADKAASSSASSASPAKMSGMVRSASDEEKSASAASAALPASSVGLFSYKPAAASSAKSESLLVEDVDGIPFVLLCPISQDLLDDPVKAKDGVTYSRKEIERIIAGKPTFISPIKNKEVSSELVADDTLRSAVLEFKVRQAKKKAAETKAPESSSNSPGPGK